MIKIYTCLVRVIYSKRFDDVTIRWNILKSFSFEFIVNKQNDSQLIVKAGNTTCKNNLQVVKYTTTCKTNTEGNIGSILSYNAFRNEQF